MLCGQVAWPPSTGCRKSVHLKEMLHPAAGALSGTSRCLAGWPQGKEPELRIWLLGFRVVWSLGRGKQFSGHFVGAQELNHPEGKGPQGTPPPVTFLSLSSL